MHRALWLLGAFAALALFLIGIFGLSFTGELGGSSAFPVGALIISLVLGVILSLTWRKTFAGRWPN